MSERVARGYDYVTGAMANGETGASVLVLSPI